MAAETLVRSDVDAGLKLIEILDHGGFGVAAALWVYLSTDERWKLLIAYEGERRDISKKSLEAHTLVHEWRKAHPHDLALRFPTFHVTNSTDPLIAGLKRETHVEGTGEVRVQNWLVDGIYVEDALIHRLAA